MTCPDPRLLCPKDALPFVPDDCEAWHCNGCGYVTRWCEPWCSNCDVSDGSEVVDFSAPPLRDGGPARLDALFGFGLAIIDPKALRIGPVEKVRGGPQVILWGKLGILGVLVESKAPAHLRRFHKEIVTGPWPDLAGLSADDAGRAVAVVALKAKKNGVKP